MGTGYRWSSNVCFDKEPEVITRKGTVRKWLFLGKVKAHNLYCELCGKPIKGQAYLYVYPDTGQRIGVCQVCIDRWEKNPSMYKLRKKQEQLERKLDRLRDPDKVQATLNELHKLENEIEARLRVWGKRDNPNLHIKEAYPYGAPMLHVRGKATFDPEIQRFLKHHGFHWEPSYHAWVGANWNTDYSPMAERPDNVMNRLTPDLKKLAEDLGHQVFIRGSYENPIRHTKQGWYWGSRGPFNTREKALQVMRAIYASGYKNPLTATEKSNLRGWANTQYAISRKYSGIDPVRSEFYHGRSVAAGKIASTYNPVPISSLPIVAFIGQRVTTPSGRTGTVQAIRNHKVKVNWNGVSTWYPEAQFIRVKAEAKGYSNPVDLYESFHGVPVTKSRKVYYEPPPKELIAVGNLKQLNYQPIRGQRANTEFWHKSGDTGETKLNTNLILATDKAGKNLYLVKKSKAKRPYFSEQGIIG